MRVLVVEDDSQLAGLIAEGLRRGGMAVDVAFDGATALDKAQLAPYEVVVLDRHLPVIHGDEVCRRLLEGGAEAPKILMLTAADAERDEVHGLSIGADDYLGKPVSLSLLTARVRALARRTAPRRSPLMTHGDLVVDTARRFAVRGGVPLNLSRKELAVLEVLLDADGAVVSAEQLLETVWDENVDPFTNTVRVTIMKLRRKLGEPAVIVTVPGEGYRV